MFIKWESDEERFWAKVDVRGPDDCWDWRASTKSGGYGQFMSKIGLRWRPVTAHRVMYEMFYPPIPTGYDVDHLCRRRICVNPSHLEAVTPTENRRRQANPRDPTTGRFVSKEEDVAEGQAIGRAIMRAGYAK